MANKIRPVERDAAANPRLGTRYRLGALLEAKVPRAYEPGAHEPSVRRLRIFAADPSVSSLQGNEVTAEVPYEPLPDGISGRLFSVHSDDAQPGKAWQRANLEDRAVIMRHGYDPSEADPRFHQQMVYAVCSRIHCSFRGALGRQLAWNGAAAKRGLLAVYPLGLNEDNAYYDADAGELRFGYFQAMKPAGRTLPGSFVFTSLSHDVIAHEMTHALLDGLRAQFLTPSSPDVTAFHEGFSDLIALFHHFTYEQAVRHAVNEGRGDLRHEGARYLFEIAQQFGRADGEDRGLRSALSPLKYDRRFECHDLGEVLLATVYDAFCTVYRRKTARYIQLATGGTGLLPQGRLHPDLLGVLTEQAQRLAQQFLSILIRAIDYCPPVDVQFGEFLQAIITADRELVTEDPWGYREAFIDAFRARGIVLRNVRNLSERLLTWCPPRKAIPPIRGLSFAELRFAGDPGCPASVQELRRQACALGELATQSAYMEEFGIVGQGDKRLRGARVDLPQIESIRTVRRAGPDGRVVFDLVAEITQRCVVPRRNRRAGFEYWGGSTVIIDPTAQVRFVIRKSVAGDNRRERRQAFLDDARAAQFWKIQAGQYVLRGQVSKLLHGRPRKTSRG